MCLQSVSINCLYEADNFLFYLCLGVYTHLHLSQENTVCLVTRNYQKVHTSFNNQ